MRHALALALTVAAASVTAAVAGHPTQTADRMNPIIALQEKGLPVFGIAHPAIARGGAGPRPRRRSRRRPLPAPPPPPIVLADVAKETVAYTARRLSLHLRHVRHVPQLHRRDHQGRRIDAHASVLGEDRHLASQSGERQRRDRPPAQRRARGRVDGSRRVGAGSARRDQGDALRVGRRHAPRNRAREGGRVLGPPVEQYKKKADMWPLNKNGELLVTRDHREQGGPGRRRARLRPNPASGRSLPATARSAACSAAIRRVARRRPRQILAACKEFKIPCGFPTNNPAEMEQRMKEGWTVHIMQRRDENAFAAVETGRKMGGEVSRRRFRGGVQLHGFLVPGSGFAVPVLQPAKRCCFQLIAPESI